jgi:catechol 2,3-dioxygenase-like lactoylglutathione lyase family enzyme
MATSTETTAMGRTTAAEAVYEIRAIAPDVLTELRERDDAGALPRLLVDEEGGSPLRCCLRRIDPGERVALVSYAPLRRWARQTGADLVQEPTTMPWGNRSILFRDPDGNLVNFFTPVTEDAIKKFNG